MLRGIQWFLAGFDHAQRLISLAIFAGVIGSVSFVLFREPVSVVIGILVALLVLIILAGAYGQWDDAERAYRPYRDTRPLQASLEPDDSQHRQRWWNIEVHNPNPGPVRRCYGKIATYRKIDVIGEWRDWSHKVPLRGLKLMWRVGPGDEARQYSDIGGGSRDWFSVAAVHVDEGGKQSDFYTPQPAAKVTGGSLPMVARPLALEFPLPIGTYAMDVEIGSEEEAFPLTNVALRIIYAGDLDLQVAMQSIPDRAASQPAPAS